MKGIQPVLKIIKIIYNCSRNVRNILYERISVIMFITAISYVNWFSENFLEIEGYIHQMMITDRDRCHAGMLLFVTKTISVKVSDDSVILAGLFINSLRLNEEQKSNRAIALLSLLLMTLQFKSLRI